MNFTLAKDSAANSIAWLKPFSPEKDHQNEKIVIFSKLLWSKIAKLISQPELDIKSSKPKSSSNLLIPNHPDVIINHEKLCTIKKFVKFANTD